MVSQLSPTLEDYLQAILRIEREKHFARVRDISDALSVAKSAVTNALRRLSEKDLVNYRAYEPVTLSTAGRRRAEKILLRHRIIVHFLENILGLEPNRAEPVACGMEHAIDRDALERFTCFLAFVGHRREEGQSWLDEFQCFINEGAGEQTCEQCIEEYLRKLRTNSAEKKT